MLLKNYSSFLSNRICRDLKKLVNLTIIRIVGEFVNFVQSHATTKCKHRQLKPKLRKLIFTLKRLITVPKSASCLHPK